MTYLRISRRAAAIAIAAHKRHRDALSHIPGVVGTAVGRLPNGKAVVKLLLANSDVRGLARWTVRGAVYAAFSVDRSLSS